MMVAGAGLCRPKTQKTTFSDGPRAKIRASRLTTYCPIVYNWMKAEAEVRRWSHLLMMFGMMPAQPVLAEIVTGNAHHGVDVVEIGGESGVGRDD